MPDDLYDKDILLWSGQQAELLRRVARGERVNGVDWDHVVEEIEDVGLSQLSAVNSHLRQLLVHLLKLRAWPDSLAAEHWRNELVLFQAEAADRFVPSMRQRIDVVRLYRQAHRIVGQTRIDGREPGALPESISLGLDDLLAAEPTDLLRRMELDGSA